VRLCPEHLLFRQLQILPECCAGGQARAITQSGNSSGRHHQALHRLPQDISVIVQQRQILHSLCGRCIAKTESKTCQKKEGESRKVGAKKAFHIRLSHTPNKAGNTITPFPLKSTSTFLHYKGA